MNNFVRKPYSHELGEANKVTPEIVKKIFPILKVLIKTPDNYEIDTAWVKNECNVFHNDLGQKDDIYVGIEFERASEKVWATGRFRYPDASFLPRKKCYANKTDYPYPCFFVRRNHYEDDAYVHYIDYLTVGEDQKEIPRSDGSIAVKGESRYSIPLGHVIMGIDCVEPFIASEWLKMKYVSDYNKMFKEYCNRREKIGRPVPYEFYDKVKKRQKFLEKINPPKIEEQVEIKPLTIFDVL